MTDYQDDRTILMTSHQKNIFLDGEDGLKFIKQTIFTEISEYSSYYILNPQDKVINSMLNQETKMIGKKLVLLNDKIVASSKVFKMKENN